MAATIDGLDKAILMPAAQLIWDAQAQGKRRCRNLHLQFGGGGPLNRAPRTSILAETIVLQALSVILQQKRNITPAEYVLRHPGGSLGRLRNNEK